MGIVAGIMVPHPPLIIPAVGKGEERIVADTIRAYEQAAQVLANHKPDVLVITSPHAPAFLDAFHISAGSRASGSFAQFGAPRERFTVHYDEKFVALLTEEAEAASIPITHSGGYAGNDLDHGTMVPLWFIDKALRGGAERSKHDFAIPIVRIGLSGLSLVEQYRLGKVIRDVAETLGYRTGFVASGDLSHKLTQTGPYGFSPEGPIYDERIMDVMGRGAFPELLSFSDAFCDDAAECGHRSFTIMGGCFEGLPLHIERLSHEPQTGVGYGICTYEVVEQVTDDAAQGAQSEGPYVRLARNALRAYIVDGIIIDPPDDLPAECYERTAGTFVSLHEFGDLRGCIGTLGPTEDCIAKEIIRNAISASTQDPRFPPVREEEIDQLEISVDVLGPMEPIQSPDQLDPIRYGVVVSKGWKRGLLLPNLEGVDTVDEQVAIAKQKAGIRPYETVSLERFEVVRHY